MTKIDLFTLFPTKKTDLVSALLRVYFCLCFSALFNLRTVMTFKELVQILFTIFTVKLTAPTNDCFIIANALSTA
jgi:hypothetical protein